MNPRTPYFRLLLMILLINTPACTHLRDYTMPTGTTMEILEASSSLPFDNLSQYRINLRVVYTDASKKQDSMTMVGQFTPAESKLEVWLLSDFGAVSFHGTKIIGQKPEIELNQTTLKTELINQCLLEPITESLAIAVLYNENAIPTSLSPNLKLNEQETPSVFTPNSNTTVESIRLENWQASPDGKKIPYSLLILSLRPFFEAQVNMLEIAEI